MLYRGVVEIDPTESGSLRYIPIEPVNERQRLPFLSRPSRPGCERLQDRDRDPVIPAQTQRQREVHRQSRVAREHAEAPPITILSFLMLPREIFCDAKEEQ